MLQNFHFANEVIVPIYPLVADQYIFFSQFQETQTDFQSWAAKFFSFFFILLHLDFQFLFAFEWENFISKEKQQYM